MNPRPDAMFPGEVREEQDRCPTCGRFLELDPDGFYDTIPGGVDGHDYLACYCDAGCAARKDPPSISEAEADARKAVRS